MTKHNLGDDERRRHPRVGGPVPCLLRDDTGVESSFELLDLSESGVRLRSARSLAAMTQVGIELVLPARRLGSPKDIRLVTRGVVVWCHEVKPGTFDTGVFFPQLADTDRRTLKALATTTV